VQQTYLNWRGRSLTKKETFLKAKTYALYYGRDRSDELSYFDFVIVEPDGQTNETVKKLQSNETLVFAYISIMEISPSSPDFELLNNEDFILKDRIPLQNQTFGTYFINLASHRWNKILLNKLDYLLYQLGYDGVFLDTIGNVESTEIPLLYRDLMYSYAINIIKLIREKYVNSLIIQNNGLNFLLKETACLIDGVCWENPVFGEKDSKLWTNYIIKYLYELNKKKGVKILLLCEQKDNGKKLFKSIKYAEKIAKSKGFLYYKAPYQYIAGINFP
jgi:polysaccharide biosynthesis protein PelA